MISIRPLLIALGAIFATFWIARRKASWPRDEAAAERRFGMALTLLCLGFLVLAIVAKASQLHALDLNALDFWLFDDMIRQMSRGGFFLTRFAPQGTGWLQHGAIHANLSFVVALPLSWIIGPTGAALVFNALCLAGAGALLGLVARKRLGAAAGLAFAAAFLASNQVGRILMYDVHPEAAYPLFVLLWVWGMIAAPSRWRWPAIIAASVAGLGLKEDAFLVFFPIFALAAMSRAYRREGLISLAVGACVYAFQLHAVSAFAHGAWGPSEWQGMPVTIPHGISVFGGRHWDSLESAGAVLADVSLRSGGALAMLGSFLRFLVSRPWLSLLALAPWILLRPAFWLATLPLVFAISQLDGPNKLWTYYSAPLLGLIWIAAALALPPARRGWARWTLVLSLVLGGAGIEYHHATELGDQVRREATALSRCLGGARDEGLVAPPFLGLVERDHVRSERVPLDSGSIDQLGFALFDPELPRYETPAQDLARLRDQLDHSPDWQRIGQDCSPLVPGQVISERVRLYVRMPR